MKHQLKGVFTLVTAVATSLGLLGAVASLGDLDRETLAHTLLAESLVAAAFHSDPGR